jgi:hypothetical protein
MPGAVAPPTRRFQRLFGSATRRPSAGVQGRQVDGSSVRARAHLPPLRPHASFSAGRARLRHPARAFTRGHPRHSPGAPVPIARRPSAHPASRLLRALPRHEVPGFGAVSSLVRLTPGTVVPVLRRVSARQSEPTAGWRDCPRHRSLLAANQWIAETSAVVEPILRRPSPHSLPIESLLVPEAKARPISWRGEKTWSLGKCRGTRWEQWPRAGSFGPWSMAGQRGGQWPGGDGSPYGVRNPCLHLESLARGDLMTCGRAGKRPLTCCFGSWLPSVATPCFSSSCGIFAGSG